MFHYFVISVLQVFCNFEGCFLGQASLGKEVIVTQRDPPDFNKSINPCAHASVDQFDFCKGCVFEKRNSFSSDNEKNNNKQANIKTRNDKRSNSKLGDRRVLDLIPAT